MASKNPVVAEKLVITIFVVDSNIKIRPKYFLVVVSNGVVTYRVE